MFEKVFKYYDKKLTAYYLVFRFIKVWWYSGYFLLILSGFCIAIITILLAAKKYQLQDLLLLIPIILMVFVFHCFNAKCKKINREKYGIESDGYIWRDVAFEEMQVELLLKYLGRNNLDTEGQIKYLISLAYKEADKKKYSGFIWPGVSLALFIPIWTQFVSNGFERASNPQDSLNIAGSFVSVSIFVLFCLAVLKYSIEEFRKAFFNSEYRKLISFGRLLEGVLLKVMSHRGSMKVK